MNGGDGWRQWFLREGRLRSLWRLLLFAALFLAILWLELMLLPFLATVPLEDGFSPLLVGQFALVLAAALAAGWIMLRFVEGRAFDELGFAPGPGVPRELGVGLVIGALALAGAVAVLVPFGAFGYAGRPGSPGAWLQASGSALLLLAIPAAAEEALFRGYAFRTLVEGTGPVVATAATSGLFAIAHGANPEIGLIGVVNIFLAGVVLAVSVLRTGSLWFATAVHLGWNWGLAGVLDLPVSGLDSFDLPLYDPVATGAPGWLTGGAFGPEGGLVGTLAALVLLVMVVWLTRPGTRLAAAAPDWTRDRVEH